MTAFQIKLIAIITMVIDHIGLFFFPQIVWFRVVGRLSFPLFAWLIANGAHHTHSINAYLRRLFLFAVLSQVPYFLANRLIDSSFWTLNVLFTLFLGLLAIKGIMMTTDKRKWVIIVIFCVVLASLFKTDYEAMGVLSVVAFYIFFTNKRYLIWSQIVIFLAPVFVQFGVSLYHHDVSSAAVVIKMFELPGLFSLVFIMFYNGKEGIKTKYFLYVFYVVQYWVIFFLK